MRHCEKIEPSDTCKTLSRVERTSSQVINTHFMEANACLELLLIVLFEKIVPTRDSSTLCLAVGEPIQALILSFFSLSNFSTRIAPKFQLYLVISYLNRYLKATTYTQFPLVFKKTIGRENNFDIKIYQLKYSSTIQP